MSSNKFAPTFLLLFISIENSYTDGIPSNSLNVPIPVGPVDEARAKYLMEMQAEEGDDPHEQADCSTRDVLPDYLNGTDVKNANKLKERLWNKTFDVFLDPNWSPSPDNNKTREQFRTVMERLQEVFGDCLQMRIYPDGATEPTGDYVHVYKEGRCASELVGRKGGKQFVTFMDGCKTLGSFTHELMHALGLAHEHNRYDRDRYVDVHWENIEPDGYMQFVKVNPSHFSAFEVPYDYQSQMHYNDFGYSKNGHDTLTAKDGSWVGGDRFGVIRDSDRLKLRRMYSCGD